MNYKLFINKIITLDNTVRNSVNLFPSEEGRVFFERVVEVFCVDHLDHGRVARLNVASALESTYLSQLFRPHLKSTVR